MGVGQRPLGDCLQAVGFDTGEDGLDRGLVGQLDRLREFAAARLQPCAPIEQERPVALVARVARLLTERPQLVACLPERSDEELQQGCDRTRSHLHGEHTALVLESYRTPDRDPVDPLAPQEVDHGLGG